MPVERIEAVRKLKRLSHWLNKGWENMDLITDEHLNGTSAIITEQWNQEQKLSKTETKTQNQRQKNENSKTKTKNQTKSKKNSHNYGYRHGY